MNNSPSEPVWNSVTSESTRRQFWASPRIHRAGKAILGGFLGFMVGLILLPAIAQATPILPDFNAATFETGAAIDNPYFPVMGKETRFYYGEKEEDGEVVAERFELTPLGEGPVLLGVQTTILRDRAYEDGMIVEETHDYYAQDTDGNVWYFGEDVVNFIYNDEGELIGTNNESAWLAGENGALPGFIMPADLTIGFNYYQEFAANDEALDQATTYALLDFVDLDIGQFVDVLQVLETSELESDSREFKYYAPGLGLILVEEGLDPAFGNPEISLQLVAVRKVPEPDVLPIFAISLALITLVGSLARTNS